MGKEEQSKAEELFNKYKAYFDMTGDYYLATEEREIELAKECAQIAVNEVLTTLRNQAILSDEDLIYWTRVQRELNKIK